MGGNNSSAFLFFYIPIWRNIFVALTLDTLEMPSYILNMTRNTVELCTLYLMPHVCAVPYTHIDLPMYHIMAFH